MHLDDQQFKPSLGSRLPFPLHIEFHDASDYELLRRFEFRSAEHGKTIGEDAGYRYDMGTVPWLARWFVDRVTFGRAYTIHDIACDRKTWDDGTPIDRKTADGLFLEVALYVHRGRWRRFKARTVYRVLRGYGIATGQG